MQNANLIVEKEREYDVFVAGSGLSGIAAAIGAARDGLKVGMIEYFGHPGGVPVSGILGVVSGLRSEDEYVVEGFMQELLARCRSAGGVMEHPVGMTEHPWCGMFDPEKLTLVILDMLAENGVDLRLYTQLIGAETAERRITAALTASKSGIQRVKAKLFIDATGDGDLAAMSGCPYEMGRASDGKTQSSSLTFGFGNVDADRIPPTPEITAIWQQYQHNVLTDHAVVNLLPHRGGVVLNMAHILDCNGLNDLDLVRIRHEGTKQAFEVLAFFREHVPGFENAVLSMTAEQPGVRETRRIIGDYMLTEEDVLAGRDFDDQIARCRWPMDIHNPLQAHTDKVVRLKRSYGIPYRCLTPPKFDNLYVVGRAISADCMAFSSSRINGTCVAIGQAAGTASADAISCGTHSVDVKRLQARLRKHGAIVGRTMIEIS